MAILMRRTLKRTIAPILSSLRRMVPQVAAAKHSVVRQFANRAKLDSSQSGHQGCPPPVRVARGCLGSPRHRWAGRFRSSLCPAGRKFCLDAGGVRFRQRILRD
jgi:hypothetical protein